MAKSKAVRPGKPRMPSNVLLKLIAFTILLFVVPVSLFYFCKNVFFASQKNSEVYAAAASVVGANLVLLTFFMLTFENPSLEESVVQVSEKKLKQKVEEAQELEEEEPVVEAVKSRKSRAKKASTESSD